MTLQLGVVMDPIASIKPQKDSTLAMLLAAQKRGWSIHYMLQSDVYLLNGISYAHMQTLTVEDHTQHWFNLGKTTEQALQELDIILMRKDPPVNAEYLYTLHLLELAEQHGVSVINKPSSLRDVNEKLFISHFAELCAPTLVTQHPAQICDFLHAQHTIIVKPLDGMGGASVFKLTEHGDNINVILETITQNGARRIMAQRYIPEIAAGDKRILMLNGEPFPYALARIPAQGEHRGNLAAGGSSRGQELSTRDYEICARIGPVLQAKGILFAGIDVIGNYLTEINVTSPTCIRELDKLYHQDIAGQLLDIIEQKHAKHRTHRKSTLQ